MHLKSVIVGHPTVYGVGNSGDVDQGGHRLLFILNSALFLLQLSYTRVVAFIQSKS